MSENIIYFNGEKYIRNSKNKYYFKYTTKNTERNNCKQLHRVVWEYYNGEIPKGFHIHHKDGNIDNNDVENLECLPSHEHLSNHMKKNWKNHEYRKKYNHITFADENRQDKARAWHSSKEGKEWHRQHALKTLLKPKPVKINKCEWCKNEYVEKKIGQIYCSISCQQKSSNYKKTKVCVICNKKFHSTSYKLLTCSPECKKDLRLKK